MVVLGETTQRDTADRRIERQLQEDRSETVDPAREQGAKRASALPRRSTPIDNPRTERTKRRRIVEDESEPLRLLTYR